jgi:hypothetical protein
MKKILIALFVCSLFSGSAFSQTALVGIGNLQAPFFTDWKRIETSHFIFLYPSNIEAKAKESADFMEYAFPYLLKTSGAPIRKTTILLYPDLASSNGMVTLFPMRSEWYLTPMQNFYGTSTEWMRSLAVHEYRHALQFYSLDQGFIRALKVMFGEVGLTVGMGLGIPTWYFEGEAVLTETALSDSGRGRSPEFSAAFRAELLSGKRYGYYKALMGSYYDHTPLESPYLSGFFIASKLRMQYGSDILNQITGDSSTVPVPYRFTHMVSRYTKKHTSDHYEELLDELYKLWSDQIKDLKVSDAFQVTRTDKRDWTYFGSPVYSGRDVVTLRDNCEIEYVDYSTGNRKSLVTADPLDLSISSASGKVVWCEEVPDPRWGMRSYSEIYTYNIKEDSKKKITRSAKVFAPSLSKDGSKIICTEFTPDQNSALVILDAETGNELHRISGVKGDFIANPAFSPDGTKIVFESLHAVRGNAIFMCDENGGNLKTIIPYSHEGIKHPVTDGSHVYYNSSYSGIDAIYAADVKSGKQYQVVSRKFGAYKPVLSDDNRKILYSDVTADGYMVAESPNDPSLWIPIESINVHKVNYAESVTKQEAGKSIIIDDLPESEKKIENYGLRDSLVRIHSWFPWYDSLNKNFSLSLYSINMLNTMSLQGDYIYNRNEKTHSGGGMISYAGFYPIFDISGIAGQRTVSYTEKVNTVTKTKFDTWNEKTVTADVRLPLYFSRAGWYRQVQMSGGIKYTDKNGINHITDYDKDNNGLFLPVFYSADFTNVYLDKGYVNPKWGQLVSASFAHTPIKGEYKGSLLSVRSVFYFPGILRRANFYAEGTFERQNIDVKSYIYESKVLFPRGYTYGFHEKFIKGSVNYTLPLFYPDHNIFWLFYLKRIYLNGFYDYGVGIDRSEKQYFRSSGGELMFEIKPLNIMGYYGVHLGMMYARAFDAESKKKNVIGVVFGIASGY